MGYDIRQSIAIIFTVVLIAFATILYSGWRTFDLVIQKSNWVSHTNEVLQVSEHVISLLKDTETGQRGYLITTDSAFLQPYFAGKDSLQPVIKRLHVLVSDNPIQHRRIDTLSALMSQRLQILGSLISKSANESIYSAYFQTRFLEGKISMDKVRALVKKIKDTEYALLIRRKEELIHSIALFKNVTLILVSVLIVFITGSYFVYRKQLISNIALQSKNQNLNEELMQYNEELKSAGEELYSTNEELAAANEEYITANEKLRASHLEIEKLNSDLHTKLGNILDHSTDFIAFADPHLRMQYINPAGRKMAGISAEFDVTQTFTKDYIDPVSYQEIIVPSRKILLEEGSWKGETILRKMNGETIPVSIVNICHRNNKNEIEYYSTSIRDISDIKNTQAQLIESEKRYKLLFDSNPMPMYIVDSESLTFKDVNNVALEKYEYTKEEFLQLSIWDIRPKEEFEKIGKLAQRPPEKKLNRMSNIFHKSKSGKIFEVEGIYYAFKLDGRNVVLALITDVTDQRKAERELAINEERLRFALEATGEGVYDWDRVNNGVYVSEKWRNMLEIYDDLGENYVQIWMSKIHPDDLPYYTRELGRISQERIDNWEINYRIKKTSGEYIWVLSKGKVIARDDQGNAIRTIGIISDISNRKKHEIALLESEKRYKLLFENNPNAMFVFNKQTLLFTEVNDAAIQKYGYSKEEFFKMKVIDILPEEDIQNLQPIIEQKFSDPYLPAKVYVGEWVHKTKNGALINVEITNYGFEEFGINERLSVIVDITERKRSENQLIKINEELLLQNSQLDKYAYVVSHNVRGPVATILGLCELYDLDADPTDEMKDVLVKNVKNMVTKLDEVIKDLNKVLAIRNQITEAMEMVKFEEITDSVEQLLWQQIDVSQAIIIKDFDSVPEIFTIKSYMLNIFQNMISNAIKYKIPDTIPEIYIKSETIDSFICITFADKGLGIDLNKNRDKLFGLYKRFHTHQEGKGLGLYLIKTEVESLKGRIEIDSTPNVGTTFRIFIPPREMSS